MTRSSRRRQLLAIYLDYLIFTALYQPVAWAIRSTVPADHWLLALAVFAGLRSLAAWALNLTTPGEWALGIHHRQVALVEPRIRKRERWWTATAGVLLVLEGSKNLVRWTEGLPVAPLLGLSSPPWLATIAIMILGGLNVVAGLLVLRTRSIGAAIGSAVLGLEALAAMIHRDDFREWASQAVSARRALQGLPVREGEIAMMQTITSTVLPAVLAVGIVWLFAIAARFNSDSRPASHVADEVTGA